jgi:hypothetical protein
MQVVEEVVLITEQLVLVVMVVVELAVNLA